MIIECFDKDKTSNDMVGKTEIILAPIMTQRYVDNWFALKHPHKGKPAGEVHLQIKFKDMRYLRV